MSKTGDESTKRRIDDLQILLELDKPITMTKKDRFYVSQTLPENYFEWKLVSSKATHDCCKDPRPMKIWLAEEANRDDLLRDNDKKPNFPWAETFATLANNKIRIYTNNEFDLLDTKLSYYRQPRRIEMTGVVNAYTGLISTSNVISEFKDDIVELFINETVKILAGDIESINISQIADNAVETNN